jgi:hypothetical protein
MQNTTLRDERHAHFEQLKAEGFEPREAARIAKERALNASAIWAAAVMAEEPAPNVDDAPYVRKALTPGHSKETRVIPFEVARSALFGVFNPNTARPEDVVEAVFPVYGTDGGTVTYKGPQLRQDDRQVLLEALELERETPGEALIKPNQFLVALGWSRSSQSRKKLLECLNRLADAQVVVHVKEFQRRVKTHLLTSVEDERPDGNYLVTFHGNISQLFKGSYYTQLDREYERNLERRAELARWLMVFYSTYEDPLPLLLTTLQEACGCKCESDRDRYDFKDKVTAAVKQLIAVGFLKAGGITKKTDGKAGTERVWVKRTIRKHV